MTVEELQPSWGSSGEVSTTRSRFSIAPAMSLTFSASTCESWSSTSARFCGRVSAARALVVQHVYQSVVRTSLGFGPDRVHLLFLDQANRSRHQIADDRFHIAANIANKFGEAGSLGRSALIASGLVLFALTLAVNLIARYVIHRSGLEEKSAAA